VNDSGSVPKRGFVGRFTRRRVTRDGLGYFAWVPFSLAGAGCLIALLRGIATTPKDAVLLAIVAAGCLAFAWYILTEEPKD
jgi:hypothetical protein